MVLASTRGLTSTLLLLTATPLLAMPHYHRGPTAAHASRTHARVAERQSVEHHAAAAPAGISPTRATQIQTALIKNGYLTGEPSGVWDSSTQAALSKLQSENGWQTKFVPDSRAIIKLGLGPGADTSAGIQASEAPSTFPANQ